MICDGILYRSLTLMYFIRPHQERSAIAFSADESVSRLAYVSSWCSFAVAWGPRGVAQQKLTRHSVPQKSGWVLWRLRLHLTVHSHAARTKTNMTIVQHKQTQRRDTLSQCHLSACKIDIPQHGYSKFSVTERKFRSDVRGSHMRHKRRPLTKFRCGSLCE